MSLDWLVNPPIPYDFLHHLHMSLSSLLPPPHPDVSLPALRRLTTHLVESSTCSLLFLKYPPSTVALAALGEREGRVWVP